MNKPPQVNSGYFLHRNINETCYSDFDLPPYFNEVLPVDKKAEILDIGCGIGQTLLALKKKGYFNLTGIDILDEAINTCLSYKINAVRIDDLLDFKPPIKFDLVIMSHVLEHIKKPLIVESLSFVRCNLLKPNGSLIIMVPNAQSATGCYWAYEDFTHCTIFTAGSLYFVLKMSGFENIEFLDPDGLKYSRPIIRQLRKMLLSVYKINMHFWNMVTGSSFHNPSPQIFTFEIKALAR